MAVGEGKPMPASELTGLARLAKEKARMLLMGPKKKRQQLAGLLPKLHF